MASSFLSTASKKVTDVRGFLREAANGNSIKYVTEKGAKHIIYIPYEDKKIVDEDGVEQVVRQLVAISGNVHEWQGSDGKYKSTVCMKDVVIPIDEEDHSKGYRNDGTCPFCDRVSAAWDIWRYRKELEEANCKLTGEERKKHLEKINSTLTDERKAKDASTYMYILVVKYRLVNDDTAVLGADGLPEYDLKVMKLSSKRVEKMMQQVTNSGAEFMGSEIMFEYPNTDDRRLLVSQSTTAPLFTNKMKIVEYPALLNKINADVKKFEWDGIEKSFPEWAGMTSMEAKKITDDLFEKWDEYVAELEVNPGARYMEYVSNVAVTNPTIGANVIPSVALPTVGTTNVAVAPTVAAAPQLPDVNQMQGVANAAPPIPDVNAVFSTGAPSINI